MSAFDETVERIITILREDFESRILGFLDEGASRYTKDPIVHDRFLTEMKDNKEILQRWEDTIKHSIPGKTVLDVEIAENFHLKFLPKLLSEKGA